VCVCVCPLIGQGVFRPVSMVMVLVVMVNHVSESGHNHFKRLSE